VSRCANISLTSILLLSLTFVKSRHFMDNNPFSVSMTHVDTNMLCPTRAVSHSVSVDSLSLPIKSASRLVQLVDLAICARYRRNNLFALSKGSSRELLRARSTSLQRVALLSSKSLLLPAGMLCCKGYMCLIVSFMLVGAYTELSRFPTPCIDDSRTFKSSYGCDVRHACNLLTPKIYPILALLAFFSNDG